MSDAKRRNFFVVPLHFFWLYKYNESFWRAVSWCSVQFGHFLVFCSSTLDAPHAQSFVKVGQVPRALWMESAGLWSKRWHQNGDKSKWRQLVKTATISQNSDRSKISVQASSVNLNNRGFMFECCITIPANTDIRNDSHIGICYCIYSKIQQCQYINMSICGNGTEKDAGFANNWCSQTATDIATQISSRWCQFAVAALLKPLVVKKWKKKTVRHARNRDCWCKKCTCCTIKQYCGRNSWQQVLDMRQ